MTDIEDVIESVVFGRRPSMPTGRHVQRLGDSAFHLDYGDPDRVFLITVEQIVRTPLSFERPLYLAEVGRVRAELIKVAVANHVEVEIDAEQGSARQAAVTAFSSRMDEWASRADHTSPPPSWPAEAFAAIQIEITDDVGTRYRLNSGQAGGHGTEFLVRWRLRPIPPATANRLTLHFTSPHGPPIELDLNLDA